MESALKSLKSRPNERIPYLVPASGPRPERQIMIRLQAILETKHDPTLGIQGFGVSVGMS